MNDHSESIKVCMVHSSFLFGSDLHSSSTTVPVRLRSSSFVKSFAFCDQILTRGAETDHTTSSARNGQEQSSSRPSVVEQERTAVRAMLRRLLAEDEAAQAIAQTVQQVK